MHPALADADTTWSSAVERCAEVLTVRIKVDETSSINDAAELENLIDLVVAVETTRWTGLRHRAGRTIAELPPTRYREMETLR